MCVCMHVRTYNRLAPICEFLFVIRLLNDRSFLFEMGGGGWAPNRRLYI